MEGKSKPATPPMTDNLKAEPATPPMTDNLKAEDKAVSTNTVSTNTVSTNTQQNNRTHAENNSRPIKFKLLHCYNFTQ